MGYPPDKYTTTEALSDLALSLLKTTKNLQTIGRETCWPPRPNGYPFSLIRFDDAVPDYMLKVELMPVPLPDHFSQLAQSIDATLRELELWGYLRRVSPPAVVAVEYVRPDGATVEVSARPDVAGTPVAGFIFRPAGAERAQGGTHWGCACRHGVSITRAGLAAIEAAGQLKRPATAPADATPKPPAISEDAFIGPAKLAQLFKVEPEALRKRLDRWRKTNHNGWREMTDRGPREPRFLYHVGTVRPIIEEMKASGEMSGERPAKKK